MALLSSVIQRGDRASQPAANSFGAGVLYYVTDESVLERTNGTAWESYSNTAQLSDGDKGDITVSGGGATWTIDNNAVSTAKVADDAVTYAKMQNVSATDRLLGRDTAGAGDVEEISLNSSDLEFTGSASIRNRFIGARVSASAAQSVATSTTTALTADSEDYDTDALHDNSTNPARLTALVDGYYLVTAAVSWASNTTGVRILEMRANGSDYQGRTDFDPDGSVLTPRQSTSAVYFLSAGQYVEATVFQSSGGNLDCTLTDFTMSRFPGA